MDKQSLSSLLGENQGYRKLNAESNGFLIGLSTEL